MDPEEKTALSSENEPKELSGAGQAELVPDESRDSYEKQIFDLKQLLEISKSLNSTLDYSILIDSILYTIMGQMKVLKAGLFAKKGLDTPMFTLHRNYKGFELAHDADYNIPEDHPLIRLFQKEYACYTMAEIEAKIGGFAELEALTWASRSRTRPSPITSRNTS
jgi:hypothetical protein